MANTTYAPVMSGPSSPDFIPAEGYQKQDVTLKIWVRALKLASRILSLACSTVVIGLSATSFSIFLSTRDLTPIDGVRPWAKNTNLWPQILVLVVASLSFLAAAIIMASYLRGHRAAERASSLATAATIIGFAAWLAIWIAAGASLHKVRDVSGNKDMWGWACDRKAKHHALFIDRIDYDLICKLQDWNFICTIIHSVNIVASVAVWVFALWRIAVRVKMAKSVGA